MLLSITACDGMGQAMTAHTDVVAHASGWELRVQDAADILASNEQIPPDPEVVRALADLWIDYALLAKALLEDPSLAALDMDDFIAPVREQELVMRLREQVILADTTFDDSQLDALWATEGPGAEISARHILLRTPTDATDAQRDSVSQQAEALRQRAAEGESFEALALEHSQDPGSAVRGGDLGFFSRGRMVEPFEEAAFALQPGEISPVVETPFGYHVILVEDRRQADLGDQREDFRAYLVQRSIEDAETAYLDSLSATANVQILPAGVDVVREIAGRPDQNLSGRQESRAIASYQGGDYTAGEFRQFILAQPAQVQTAFASATAEQAESAIQQLVQMKLLLAQAESSGIALTAEEDAQIRAEAREALNSIVEATGFMEVIRQGADAADLENYVMQMVRGVVTGEAQFIPLGRLGTSLRDRFPHEINDRAVEQTVSTLEQIRAQQPAPSQFESLPLPQNDNPMGAPDVTPEMIPLPE